MLYKGTAGREAERPLRGNQRGEVRRKQGGGGATRRTPTMLLAWAQGLQELYCAEDEYGVLGGEGCPEPGAGPGGLEDAGGEGLECRHCLGVRAEEGQARRDHRIRRPPARRGVRRKTLRPIGNMPEV